MNSARTRVHIYERKDGFPRGYSAAASLHSHTYHSKEVLSFVPHYASMVPVISRLYQNEMDHYFTKNGRKIDFDLGYWTTPVSPREVLEVETLQIEKELGLPALVSITDHDDIEAGLHLQVLNNSHRVPISLEWTVPFGRLAFHLGIHNLPRESATEVTQELLNFSRNGGDATRLDELLDLLNQSPTTLIVFNHPVWDMEYLGALEHTNILNSFLEKYGGWIHALEINGYRTWRENSTVLQIAEDLGYPVVSGGDRHGCQANALLNLTRSKVFDEFVAEIREDCQSEVLLMPEYRESRAARLLGVVSDVLRHYPAHSLGRAKWTDRVFIDLDGKGVSPLTRYIPQGGPVWLRASLSCLRMLGSRQLRPALRFALTNEKVARERMSYEG